MSAAARVLVALGPALLLFAGAGASLHAQTGAARPSGALLPGANSKEPVSIDAGRLDYFDKDSKLVYTGDVVAKQGEATLRASVLTIFLSKEAAKTATVATDDGGPPAAASGSSIRRMEAKGPVTIISRDEVGTGDNGSYDKGDNKITLTGNVTLTQATNVIKGDKLVYDMTSGQAQVTGGRVSSVFTPGSGGSPGAPRKTKPAGAAPSSRKVPAAAADK